MKSSNYLYLIIGIISLVVFVFISNLDIIPQWTKYFFVVPIGYCIVKGFTQKGLSDRFKTMILIAITLGSLLSVFLTLNESINSYILMSASTLLSSVIVYIIIKQSSDK